jgi:hypothetical protein
MRDIVGCGGGGAFTIPVIIQYVEVRERMDTIMLSHSSPGTQNCAMVQFWFILDKVRIQRHVPWSIRASRSEVSVEGERHGGVQVFLLVSSAGQMLDF